MRTFLALSLILSAENTQESDLGKRLKETYAAAADWLVSRQDAAGAWHAELLGKSEPSLA